MKLILRIFISLCCLVSSSSAVLSAQQDIETSIPKLVIQEGHDGYVDYVKFSQDGKYILSASNNQIKVWDAQTGFLIKTIILPVSQYNVPVDFAPDGSFFVYADKWNLVKCQVNSEESVTFASLDRQPSSLALSSDGKYIAVDAYSSIQVYDTVKLEETFSLKDEKLLSYKKIVFTEDSSRIVATACMYEEGYSSPSCIYIAAWNMNTRQLLSIQEFAPESKIEVENISVSPEGNRVAAVISKNSNVIVQDLLSGKKAQELDNKHRVLVQELVTGKKIQEIDTKGYVYDLKFTHDGEHLVTVGKGYKDSRGVLSAIALWSVETGLQKPYGSKLMQAKSLCFSPDNSKIAVGEYKRINVFELESGKMLHKIEGISSIYNISILPGTDCILTRDLGGHFCGVLDSNLIKDDTLSRDIYDVLDANKTGKSRMPNTRFEFHKGGMVYCTSKDNRTWAVYDYNFERKTSSLLLENITFPDGKEQMQSVYVDIDANFIAVKSTTNVYLYNARTKELLNTFDMAEFGDIPEISFSPKGTYLVVSPLNFIKSNPSKNNSILYNIKTGELYSFMGYKICFSDSDDFFLYRSPIGGKEYSLHNIRLIRTSDLTTVMEMQSNARDSKNQDCKSALSASGKYFSVYSHDGFYIYDSTNCKLLSSDKNISCRDAFFSPDEEHLVVLGDNNIIRIFSVQTGKLVASSIVSPGGDWLTYTPDGYFAGSEAGIKEFMHVAKGMEVFGLEQAYDELYRPDIIHSRLHKRRYADEDILSERKISLTSVFSCTSTPSVRFTKVPKGNNRSISVQFTVRDSGDGIGNIFLTHNGKPVKLSEAVPGDGGKVLLFNQKLTLYPGENKLEAYAMNGANMLEGKHAEASIKWNGTTGRGGLYILATGVNEYKEEKLRLRYSVKDAESITSMFENHPGSLYQSVNATLLTDKDVTKEKLTSEFDRLSKLVEPDDVFVLYLAGHGISDKDYYYIPYDFAGKSLYEAKEQGLSRQFITDNMSKIHARKTLILLDTCQSGAFVKNQDRISDETALNRLSHYTGQAVIAAASDSQSAFEGYKNHGIFTYVLLEALSGKADFNKDGTIILSELVSYLDNTVASLVSDEFFGRVQEPWYNLRGQKFPLLNCRD